jgi:hypothetical protein
LAGFSVELIDRSNSTLHFVLGVVERAMVVAAAN